VPFTGTCLMHRAELMQLRGQWPQALHEARLAADRFAQRSNDAASGEALYRQGEILRLQGNLAEAEQAYRAASGSGREPQPGLALLRLAQGRSDAATAAIDLVLAATPEVIERARLLPAAVEITLAAGDRDRAHSLAREIDEIAARHDSAMLDAQAAQARGAVALAGGDARGALRALRQAWKLWQELEAPYECARVRLLIAEACRAVGDDETATLELDAARAAFARLGAGRDERGTGALTAREAQVLRLLAAGRSNKEIAAELVLSKRTVDRHVSNIFTKCRVSSRAAATAYAYEHGLI
jgi:DNA-binding NarL/FixJ family response regulator